MCASKKFNLPLEISIVVGGSDVKFEVAAIMFSTSYH